MLETLARLGYASKAVIYAIVGILALLTVANRGGTITDTSGALRVVIALPLGRVLLIVLALGLCGYAAWRLLDAVADPDRDGASPRGMATRIGNFVRGCVYGMLGFEAVNLLRGQRSNGDGAQLWTARIFEWPLGEWIVGLAGGIAVAYGVSELLRGIRGDSDSKLDWSPISATMRRAIERVCLFGVAVRGGLIATLGAFLVRAALLHDPSEAAGHRASMLQLGSAFEGRWFLGLVAAGVLAYAVDQAVHARCRRIRPVM